MDLTIQQVHTYYNLVNSGKAPQLEFSGVDTSPGGSFIIPQLDENDKVYFYDTLSKTKIYPGENTIKKIQDTIAKMKYI